MYVLDGSPVGFLPNNGLVTLVASFQPDEFRLRLFCISGSLMEEVGELIGPDGTQMTSNTFLFISSISISGELVVLNGGTLTTQVFGASQQGVYTCRIPDESGIMVSVNVAIYPAGFNSEYTTLYTMSAIGHTNILLPFFIAFFITTQGFNVCLTVPMYIG